MSLKTVRLSLLSPEEIDKLSFGTPCLPLTDRVSHHHRLCSTCGGNAITCQGHFGHIDFSVPMFHPLYFSTIYKLLQCICFHCAGLLCDMSDPKVKKAKLVSNQRDRFKKLVNCCLDCELRDPKHLACGEQPTYWKHENNTITAHFEERTEDITAETARNMFVKVSDGDLKLLGFCVKYARPEWMILTKLLIPPWSVYVPNIIRGTEDDLSPLLTSIIQTNNSLKSNIAHGGPQHIINAYSTLLQYYLKAYFITGLKSGAEQVNCKSMMNRLNGRLGRIRANLLSKTVDFCATTLVVADPNLKLDEVVIPEFIVNSITTCNSRRMRIGDRMAVYLHFYLSAKNGTTAGMQATIHIPQSYITVGELDICHSIKDRVPDRPFSSDIHIGLLTLQYARFSRADMMHLLSQVSFSEKLLCIEPAILKPMQLWTGYQILLGILHKHQITNEHVLSLLDSKFSLLSGDNYEIYAILKHVRSVQGGEVTLQLISDIQSVVTAYNLQRTISFGLTDLIVRNKDRIESKKTNMETVEDDVNTLRTITAPSFRDVESNLLQLLQSGSQVYQTLAYLVGVPGTICNSRGFADRLLPHFPKNDKRMLYSGVTLNHLNNGLRPYEFFLEAIHSYHESEEKADCSVRSTRVKQALLHFLSDITIQYDTTVRDGTGRIIQFVYGDDGFQESCTRGVISARSNLEASAHLAVHLEEKEDELSEKSRKLIHEYRTLERLQQCLIKQSRCLISIPLEPILERTVQKRQKQRKDLPVTEIVDTVDKLCSLSPENTVLNFYLRSQLASKQIYCVKQLRRDTFYEMIGQIESTIDRSRVIPGDPVGAQAAKVIDSLYRNYISIPRLNYSLGDSVTRFEELIYGLVTDYPKSKIYPRGLSNVIDVSTLRSKLVHTSLSDLIYHDSVIYDPDPLHTVTKEDQYIIDMYFEMSDYTEEEVKGYSPWIIRLELKQNTLLMPMLELVKVVQREVRKDLLVMHSDDNAPSLVILIRTKCFELDEVNQTLCEIRNVTLSGVPGITRCFIDKVDAEYIVVADGCNLPALLAREDVRWQDTYSNNVHEIIATLGIEAGKSILLKEMRTQLLESSYKHLLLIADYLCIDGEYQFPMKSRDFPLAECGRSKATQMLASAARFAIEDDLSSISAQIMTASTTRIGTGAFDVLIDPQSLVGEKIQ